MLADKYSEIQINKDNIPAGQQRVVALEFSAFIFIEHLNI